MLHQVLMSGFMGLTRPAMKEKPYLLVFQPFYSGAGMKDGVEGATVQGHPEGILESCHHCKSRSPDSEDTGQALPSTEVKTGRAAPSKLPGFPF